MIWSNSLLYQWQQQKFEGDCLEQQIELDMLQGLEACRPHIEL
jgi:hypothetical protein